MWAGFGDSLPVGDTTDHILVNPFGPCSPSHEPLDLVPILIVTAGNYLLKRRAKDYAERLKNGGKKNYYVEFEGQHDAFCPIERNSEAGNKLMLVVKNFRYSKFHLVIVSCVCLRTLLQTKSVISFLFFLIFVVDKNINQLSLLKIETDYVCSFS